MTSSPAPSHSLPERAPPAPLDELADTAIQGDPALASQPNAARSAFAALPPVTIWKGVEGLSSGGHNVDSTRVPGHTYTLTAACVGTGTLRLVISSGTAHAAVRATCRAATARIFSVKLRARTHDVASDAWGRGSGAFAWELT